MSNLTKEAIADTLYNLTSDQETTLQTCIDSLQSILKVKTINESSLKTLTNIWRELDSLRDLFYMRLYNAMKRGDMIRD